MIINRRKQAGFTLLEVMVAVVILAVGLSSLFASEVGAIRIAQRARTTTVASLLARCKMAEIDEKISKEGWPATNTDGRDECCEGAEHDGFTCEWKLERIVLPDAQQTGDGDAAGGGKDAVKGALGSAAGGASGSGGSDPLAAAGIPIGGAAGGIDSMLAGKGLGGAGAGAAGAAGGGGILGALNATGGGTGGGGGDPIASLVMSYAFPVMKPIIEEQVRRATVLVKWKEGSSEQEMDVVQYLVNELPMLPPDSDDDDANNPNVNNNTGGTGGTTGGTTSTTTSSTGATAAPGTAKQ